MFRDFDYGIHGNVKWRDRAQDGSENEEACHHAVVFCDTHVENIKSIMEGTDAHFLASEGW
jgi:hypothetical protein